MTILSREPYFIFLKSRKTAGTSIEICLIKYMLNCGFSNELSYLTAHEAKKYNIKRKFNYNKLSLKILNQNFRFSIPKNIHNNYWVINKLIKRIKIFDTISLKEHTEAKNVIGLIGKKRWDESLKVTSIRNLWDLMTSYFRWHKSGRNGLGSPIYNSKIGFKDFLNLVILRKGNSFLLKRIKLARELVYPFVYINDEFACDFYIKYENLEKDFQKLCIKLFNDTNLKLPHEKSTKKLKKYKSYYDKYSVNLIKNHFKQYIKNFNYKF